ncbi:hypothetical protein CC79DRAFT_1327434 [Sarocladium strictum]
MASKGVSILKFVGTVSLGLLTGVSYTVSNLSLPSLLRLPSSSSAAQALNNLSASLKLPIPILTTLASVPLLLSFAISPRSARHPYLIYTSLLAVLSAAIPNLLLTQPPALTARPAKKQSSTSRSRMMEASYEVLGDAQSDAASEEEIDDINGEEVRAHVEAMSMGYKVRAGISTLGFAMAVLGIWGDGAPNAVVYAA